MVAERDRVSSKVTPTSGTLSPTMGMGLMDDNLASVLAHQEREPSYFSSTLHPMKGKGGRSSFGFGTSKAEIVPASNRVSLKVAEQERQLRYSQSRRTYKYMLLPDSMARYWWDLLMALVTIMLMWRIPYSISFSEDGKAYWYVFYKVTDVIYYLDIIANFR